MVYSLIVIKYPPTFIKTFFTLSEATYFGWLTCGRTNEVEPSPSLWYFLHARWYLRCRALLDGAIYSLAWPHPLVLWWALNDGSIMFYGCMTQTMGCSPLPMLWNAPLCPVDPLWSICIKRFTVFRDRMNFGYRQDNGRCAPSSRSCGRRWPNVR